MSQAQDRNAQPHDAHRLRIAWTSGDTERPGDAMSAIHASVMDDLNSRFASGQPGAVRELYRRYSGSVFAAAYRILGDVSLTEEAVQQTFLQAWRASHQYDENREVAPWLHTIARRAAIDVYRRERRHRSEEVTDETIAELPPSLEATWAAWEVRRAVDSLPAEEKAVLHATHFRGLTHQETADDLGVPLGTVKSLSHRAYRRLAGLLAHVGEAPG